MSSAPERVREGYEHQRRLTTSERDAHPLAPLWKYQNFIVASLYNYFVGGLAPLPVDILELGIGRGGCFDKWNALSNVHSLVGADISPANIAECQERIRKKVLARRFTRFRPQVHVADCFHTNLDAWLDPKLLFHVVSCQMAFHYACDNDMHLTQALSNMSHHLHAQGLVLLTFPNSIYMQELFEAKNDPNVKRIGEDKLWSITISEKWGSWKTSPHKSYTFFLQDKLEDLPEYPVDVAHVLEVAKPLGLEFYYQATFRELYEAYRKLYPQLHDTMQVLPLSASMLQVADLYQALVLVKSGGLAPHTPRPDVEAKSRLGRQAPSSTPLPPSKRTKPSSGDD